VWPGRMGEDIVWSGTERRAWPGRGISVEQCRQEGSLVGSRSTRRSTKATMCHTFFVWSSEAGQTTVEEGGSSGPKIACLDPLQVGAHGLICRDRVRGATIMRTSPEGFTAKQASGIFIDNKVGRRQPTTKPRHEHRALGPWCPGRLPTLRGSTIETEAPRRRRPRA
jgi:hypothetical protein